MDNFTPMNPEEPTNGSAIRNSRQVLKNRLKHLWIIKCIDNKKAFLLSIEFKEIYSECIDHFFKFGDSRKISEIISCFEDTIFYKPLLLWFCETCGLEYNFKYGNLSIIRVHNGEFINVDINHFISKYSGSYRSFVPTENQRTMPHSDEPAYGSSIRGGCIRCQPPKNHLKYLWIIKFIENKKEFLLSSEFKEIYSECIDHFFKFGATCKISELMSYFDDTRYYKPLLLWFCETCGLEYNFKSGNLSISWVRKGKFKNAEFKNADLNYFISKYSGSSRSMGAKKTRSISRQQRLNKLFGDLEGRKYGSICVQGGAPGLGKRH